MKTYLCPPSIAITMNLPSFLRRSLLLILLAFYVCFASAQELVFKDPVLISGVAGGDGAIYRFTKVNNYVDALVTINGRSSSLVSLVNLDMTFTGHGKAFQPQVTCNNNTTLAGISDWWMEFKISFVNTGSNTPTVVDSFNVTALDIDGNNDKINEWVSFYNLKTFLFESNTQLASSNIMEQVVGVNTLVGRKFDGPVQNYLDVDTNATSVMVTNSYQSTNSFRIRTGGHGTGVSGGADRMYSFWFKGFNYKTPSEFGLPLVLQNFTANLNGKGVTLNWTTGKEKELSHFVIERSVNGLEYNEVGIVMAKGNSDVKVNYSFSDVINTKVNGVVYYRLKMLDGDGSNQLSQVRLIRIGDVNENMSVAAYPNPVISELRVTVPASWQNKSISFDLYNASGQIVKHVVAGKASQTETLNVNDLTVGLYIMKVSNGNETAVQRIVKAK